MTSGFVIHSSEKDKNNGEVDIIGLRFPLHSQDETEHNSSPYLEITKDDIDIVIGEVKSHGQRHQFNKTLRNQQNIQKLLKWIGLFDKEVVLQLTAELQDLINPKENSKQQNLLTTNPVKTAFGKVRIRPIIFNLETKNPHGQDKYLTWTEVNDFIWNCLCPAETRIECSVKYDFNAWGYGINEIVKVYKDNQKNGRRLRTIYEIYSSIVLSELVPAKKE
jgi:hypothetical protein